MSCSLENPNVLLVRDQAGQYRAASPEEVMRGARQVLARRVRRGTSMTSPTIAREFLQVKLGMLDYEVFMVLLLDTQHRLIEAVELARGTIDGASVYPREVVKECLLKGAAAVLFAHNHPSGVAEPSAADRVLTEKLTTALRHVDVRVLDHIIVAGDTCTAFSERGWI